MRNKYKTLLLLFFLFILAVFGLFVFKKYLQNKTTPAVNVSVSTPSIQPNINDNKVSKDSTASSTNQYGFADPLDRAAERITKKPFGIYITSKTSPVQPEKFTGYHTGTDFEIFPEEADADVSIKAVCSGKLIVKKYATGYGGVAVESCMLDGQTFTAIYGHLKLASIVPSIGSDLQTGDTIGILGKAYSTETDGERKHLHLGFHKGTAVNILGYVQSQSELSSWLDPCLYICGK